MRRTLLLLLLSLATPAAAQAPGPEPVRIANRTGVEATALHAVRSGRADWGGNLLNRGPLPSGSAFNLRVNPDAGCRFDIRLVLADGRESVARDRVLTNRHVVNGCDRILARTADGRWLAAVPPARVDAGLDLALLTIPGDPGPALAFRSAPAVRRGEGVVAYGFPLAGLLSADPKLTRGEINALAGLRNDASNFQISAEVQPGNSGGPLLDMQGHVVGVVVAKLDSRRVQNVDNVNFAVKGEAAQAFLRRAGIAFRAEESRGPDRSAADVGEIAHRSTLMLRCESQAGLRSP